MDENTKFLVAGGDLRQIYLAKKLAQSFKVYTCGLGDTDTDISKLKGIDVLVLPIIISNNETHLNAPFSNEQITLESLIPCLKEDSIVTGGRFTDEVSKIFTSCGFEIVDYFKREELIIKNCIPTAEGTLQIAMEELPVTIYGSKVLILGYGRVGKATAKLFSSVGAKVAVAVRKYSDGAWCQLNGFKSLQFKDLENYLDGFDLIINTVPAKLLNANKLSLIPKNSLIIDLASKPGGVDFEVAREIGVKVIWALSIPLDVTATKQKRQGNSLS
ncbi:MAG: dipicolinate synthase subunit DpsA [Clostridiales bacterium]|nr:dipicolinate synthase subunit DpsA [Clostridiales bacterium]